MMKCVLLLAVLCGISAGYSIPMQNGFMYYQQPMGYRPVHRTMHGVHYQNQQLQDAGLEGPVQDPYVDPLADAYPTEQFPAEAEPHFDVPSSHEIEEVVPLAEEPVAAPVAPVPAPAPEKKKKKVNVDSDDDDAQVGRASGSAGPNVYFPLNFGNTKGGAIAVANSYSTGKDGSATSTATAYGSPATAELRRTAPVQLKRKPAKLRTRQN
nr:uncharacterized protein LOC109416619 [Aedes albopictus]